ncbi:MAG: copper amine oxidase [Clostridiaceae bacterium]|nr:copper amine oxidase [Clostridiaceae bacterium]
MSKKKLTAIIALVVLIAFILVQMLWTLIPLVYGESETNAEVRQDSADKGTQSIPIFQRLDNAIVLYVGSPKAYVNNEPRQIDVSNPEVCPIIKNNRTLVPVRFIAESLGASVTWDGSTSTVQVFYGDNVISMVLGEKAFTVNGVRKDLDVPAETYNGRTMIPLRAFAEALGKNVFYDRGLIIISDIKDIFDPGADKEVLDEIIARVSDLPVVGSYEKLKALLEEINGTENMKRKRMAFDTRVEAEIMQSAPAQKNLAEDTAMRNEEGSDYSATNVQVEGVDEADIVKTDGKYIYQVRNEDIVITKAYPAEDMEVVAKLKFDGENYYPQELYIDDKHLVVIGNTGEGMYARRRYGYYSYNIQRRVNAMIYDITDKQNIKLLREVEVEGEYISSRKVGANLYLVANEYIDYYFIQYYEENATPSYRDTAIKDENINIGYDDIQYFPRFTQPNYLIIAALSLDRMDEPVNISTYLGAGENIYVSQKNMYIAVTHQDDISSSSNKRIMAEENLIYTEYGRDTLIYKFSLGDGKVTYLCKGTVPGTVLNQFSMDESGDYFRIATTKGDVWRDDEYTSKNNVYVLGERLNIVGKLEDIAPGEKIYSVRFMGDRAYMVTFKQVDPLFVIDLKDVENPKILGALKIPGYSDYLHPYDENHIIGFGKDTVEVSHKDFQGNVIGSTAYYKGIKMAVFDVSDVNNPIEKFKEIIGDRGTDSELLSNHKALLFSKEKGLLSFPVTVMEVQDDEYAAMEETGIPMYVQFSFQGAYVYHIDMEKGFTLRKRITHLSEDDYAKAGLYWYDNDKNIERILYIEDTLYTLSKKYIKAHDLNSLSEINTIELQ